MSTQYSSSYTFGPEVYYQQFRSLESKFNSEFKSLNKWRYKIVNDYILRGERSVSVEVELKCKMMIRIVCDHEFPTNAPRVFCLNNYTDPLLIQDTNELNYKSVIPWLADMLIIKIPYELDNHFKDKPPQEVLDQREIYWRVKELEDMVNFGSAAANLASNIEASNVPTTFGIFSQNMTLKNARDLDTTQMNAINSKMIELATIIEREAGEFIRSDCWSKSR